MRAPRAVLVFGLLAVPVFSFGCGGYNNDNTPEIVVTPEMIQESGRKEAERLEKYRQIAADKGLAAPQTASAGPSMVPGNDATNRAAETSAETPEERAARRAASTKQE